MKPFLKLSLKVIIYLFIIFCFFLNKIPIGCICKRIFLFVSIGESLLCWHSERSDKGGRVYLARNASGNESIVERGRNGSGTLVDGICG